MCPKFVYITFFFNYCLGIGNDTRVYPPFITVVRFYSFPRLCCFDGFSVPINGEYVTVKPSRSYECTVFPRISDPAFANPYGCADLFFGAFTASIRLIRDGYISINENPSTFLLAKRYACFYYDVKSGYRTASRYDFLIFDYIRLETVQLNFDSVVGKIYRFFSSVNRTLRFWRLDTYTLLEDLKISLSKVFSASSAYWSRKSLKFLNDFYDYVSNCPDSYSFLNTRTVGFNPPSKDDSLFWNDVDSTLSFIKNSVSSRIFQRVRHKNYNDIQGILFNLNF